MMRGFLLIYDDYNSKYSYTSPLKNNEASFNAQRGIQKRINTIFLNCELNTFMRKEGNTFENVKIFFKIFLSKMSCKDFNKFKM